MHDWIVAFQSLLIFGWACLLFRMAYYHQKYGIVRKRMTLVASIPYFIMISHLGKWWSAQEYVAVTSLVLVTIAVGVSAFQHWQYRENAYNPR